MFRSLGAKTIMFPTPVLCVGSYDPAGKANVMTAAWGGICCSKPPCLTVSLRKATYTYGCIMHSRAYTVSVPSRNQVAQADYFGMYSGRDEDKFAAQGLTPGKGEFVNAPYVAEFPVVVECVLLQSVDLGLHTMFVGEIKDVKVREDCLDPEGKPDVAAIAPIAFMPEVREYWTCNEFLAKAFAIGLKK